MLVTGFDMRIPPSVDLSAFKKQLEEWTSEEVRFGTASERRFLVFVLRFFLSLMFVFVRLIYFNFLYFDRGSALISHD